MLYNKLKDKKIGDNMICPKCHNDNRYDALTCDFCMAKLPMTKETVLFPLEENRLFSFCVYFSTTSPSASASTVRAEPEASVPSMRRSAAGSSTALRMTRRRARAPNLPPWLLVTSALRAAGV